MLFNETHPPLALRMHNALKALNVGDSERVDRMTHFVMDEVGYMVYSGCTVDKWKEIFPNAAFGVDFGALEGPWSKADGHQEESRMCARGKPAP